MAKAKPAEPAKRSRTFQLSDEDWDLLTRLAEAEGRTRTAQVERMIREKAKAVGADRPAV